jgi:hypothetical protein
MYLLSHKFQRQADMYSLRNKKDKFRYTALGQNLERNLK